MISIFRAGGARIVVLVVTLALTAVANRFTIDALGTQNFGVISLIVTLTALLPFADLGIGATVTSELPSQSRSAEQIDDLIARSNGVLSIVAALVITVSVALGLLDIWPVLLGVPGEGWVSPAAATTFVSFAVSLRLGLASRVIVALDRAHLAVICQSTGPVVGLVIIALAHLTNASAYFYAVAVPIGVLCSNILIFGVATRISSVNLRATRIVGSLGRAQSIPILAHSVPMFAISILMPLLLQSDRLVIAQVGTPALLATYAVASQLFWPAYSVLTAAELPLWARFVTMRAERGNYRRELRRLTIFFGALGMALGLGLWVVTPLYQRFIGAESVEGVATTTLAFAALLVAQALVIPTRALLTTPGGLRLHMIALVCALLVKIGLTTVLIASLGAAAPVIASVVAVALQGAIMMLSVRFIFPKERL